MTFLTMEQLSVRFHGPAFQIDSSSGLHRVYNQFFCEYNGGQADTLNMACAADSMMFFCKHEVFTLDSDCR